MQVDRVFRANAAFIFKQNKRKRKGGHLYNVMVIVHCLIMELATRKNCFKRSAINGRAKGSKKKRNCGRADGERRKKTNI